MTFEWSNWPIIEASVRKSNRGFSAVVGFNVLIATVTSDFPGIFSFPRQTSPNSPPPIIASIVICEASISFVNSLTAWFGSSYVCGSTYDRDVAQLVNKGVATENVELTIIIHKTEK